MNEAQQKAYKNIIKYQHFDYQSLSEQEKASVLETAYQYVQYQYVAHKLELKDYRKQSFRILKERNSLGKQDNLKELKEGKNPLKAHESAQIGLTIGKRNGKTFQQINTRPAYTSLLDNSYGLLSGAEINFLNISARHYDNRNNFVLNSLNLVGISSISPIDFMFQPISYNIHADLTREMNPDTQKEGYVFDIHGGGGGAYALTNNIKIFGFVNSHLAYGGFLPHNSWGGIGPEIGLYADYGNWRLLTSMEKIFATSHFADKIKYNIGLSIDVHKNIGIEFGYKFNDNHGHNEEESLLSLKVFY